MKINHKQITPQVKSFTTTIKFTILLVCQLYEFLLHGAKKYDCIIITKSPSQVNCGMKN